MSDNLIAYIDNKFELSIFTGLRIYDINYKFKKSDYILSCINNKMFKIYKFI